MTDSISLTPDALAVRLAHAFERERVRTTPIASTIDLSDGTASEPGLEGGANVAAALEARLASLEDEVARVKAALERLERRSAAPRRSRKPLSERFLRAE
jgi:uncharacterized protein YceH (UPF0502 family)